MSKTHGIGTRAIHAGQSPDPSTGAVMVGYDGSAMSQTAAHWAAREAVARGSLDGSSADVQAEPASLLVAADLQRRREALGVAALGLLRLRQRLQWRRCLSRHLGRTCPTPPTIPATMQQMLLWLKSYSLTPKKTQST